MSNRFKYADGSAKERLRGARKKDRGDQICRNAGAKNDTRGSIIRSLFAEGKTQKEVDKIMGSNVQKPKKIIPQSS